MPKVTEGRLRRSVDLDERDVVDRVGADQRGLEAFVDPVRVTVIVPPLTAAAMTWLLVTTRPFAVMIMPVPWSSLPAPFTSIETTEGCDLATSRGSSARWAGPPLGGVADRVDGHAAGWVRRRTSVKWPARPPTRAATRSSDTRVDQSAPLALCPARRLRRDRHCAFVTVRGTSRRASLSPGCPRRASSDGVASSVDRAVGSSGGYSTTDARRRRLGADVVRVSSSGQCGSIHSRGHARQQI